MHLKIPDLYDQAAVSGPYGRHFSDIIIGGDKGGPDALFVHAEGTYMEGLEKMQAAYDQGCRAFIASAFPSSFATDPTTTLITVSDPLQELYRLSALIRSASPAQIIGITGSSGKTTTKDMTAHILRGRYKKTLKTYRNYNGALGVALTLRKLRPDDEFAVVEIGLGDPGSVARGAALARPHVALITNIGVSHIAKFGSMQSISREKGRLLDYVEHNGLIVANGDDVWCHRLAASSIHSTLLYGLKKDNDLRAHQVVQVSVDALSFHVTYQSQTVRFELKAVGQFQAYNALGAIAVGLHYGFNLGEMAERLAAFVPSEQRMKRVQLHNFCLFDDGYNSNPRALEASLDALESLPVASTHKIAVVGDMQYLGRYTSKYYKQLAAHLNRLDVAHIILLGEQVAKLLPLVNNAVAVQSVEQAAQCVLSRVKPGGFVLLKGQDDILFSELRREIERLEGLTP